MLTLLTTTLYAFFAYFFLFSSTEIPTCRSCPLRRNKCCRLWYANTKAMFKGHRACGPPSGPSKKGKLIKTVPRFNGKRWQVDCIAYVCFL